MWASNTYDTDMGNIKSFVFLIFTIASVVGVVFLNTDAMVDAQVMPKYYVGLFALLGLFMLIQMTHSEKDMKSFLAVLYIVCVLQSVFGICRYVLFKDTEVTGSFDNPAGLAASLCAVTPYAVLMQHNNHRWIRILMWISLSILFSAIALSGSRAGWVASFSWILAFLLRKTPLGTWKKMIMSGVLVAIMVFSVYFIKKDSADGRLLIWHCTIDLCVEKPWFGHGNNGFMAHYII